MRKLLVILLVFVSYIASAQQDAMFTKYMFNALSYNPAYAGSKDHMAVGLLHRTQWFGFEGAPSTQTMTIHTPIPNEKIALGVNIVRDAIGPINTLTGNLAYAYRIPIGPGKLSVGLQGGVLNYKSDYSTLNYRDEGDEAFSMTPENYWLPNFGLGLYYYSDLFYVGAGAPHLIEWDLRRNNVNTQKTSRLYRHYYFSAGAAIPLGSRDLVFKPSALVKSVGLLSNYTAGVNGSQIEYSVGAPIEFDIDISFLINKTLWIGGSFRSAFAAESFGGNSSFDSVDAWISVNIKNLRIGLAYDYPLTEMSNHTVGSAEVMLGYEFGQERSQIVTPRYF